MKLKSAFCIGVALALLAGPPSLAELSREQTFSGENRLTAERYVNETGAPAKGPEGYSEKKLSYSGDGAEITETFYDAGGVRVADSRGRWAVVTRLDSLGRVIKLQYLNAAASFGSMTPRAFWRGAPCWTRRTRRSPAGRAGCT